jgi:hypothetical protein
MTYLPPPTLDLSLLFCFILLAPIFYIFGKYSNTSYHGSHSTNQTSIAPQSPGQCCCGKEMNTGCEKRATIEEIEAEFRLRKKQLEAILAECKFVKSDMKREKDAWTQEWEREKQCRKAEWKKDREAWREEQIKWLWDGKKKREQGRSGWLAFGGKKQKTEEKGNLHEVLPGIEC